MGLDALAAMHDADRERGIDPFEVPRTAPAAPVVTQVRMPFPQPDWEQERIERANRAPVRAVVPELVEEDTEAQPAKPRPRSTTTPNLDEVKRWMSTQMKAEGT